MARTSDTVAWRRRWSKKCGSEAINKHLSPHFKGWSDGCNLAHSSKRQCTNGIYDFIVHLSLSLGDKPADVLTTSP
eukprot:506285-Amphidinium_carterae.1